MTFSHGRRWSSAPPSKRYCDSEDCGHDCTEASSHIAFAKAVFFFASRGSPKESKSASGKPQSLHWKCSCFWSAEDSLFYLTVSSTLHSLWNKSCGSVSTSSSLLSKTFDPSVIAWYFLLKVYPWTFCPTNEAMIVSPMQIVVFTFTLLSPITPLEMLWMDGTDLPWKGHISGEKQWASMYPSHLSLFLLKKSPGAGR